MKCCINARNFIRLLFLSAKLFNFEIQKFSQILCAHKPYFLMPSHIYKHSAWNTDYQVELGSTQILETVRYFIKYHGINNYYGILINTFMYPVKYSNNFSQVTSV